MRYVAKKCATRCLHYLQTRSTGSTANQCRQVIAKNNPTVNAFIHVSDAPGFSDDGPLSGISIAIKDNIATKSMPTTCSSAMLKDFTSPFDSTVVKLLRGSGADIIGKTNCDEFGMGSLNVHSVHGPVVNPFNVSENRSAGGSSGGSAAAVAAGMCYAALGTDTGGSIRLPASYCGVVGLKPSYGLVSRLGVVSFADSLDCVGVMATTVSRIERIFNVINVYDEQDPTSASPESRQRMSNHVQQRLHSWRSESQPNRPCNSWRVGIPQEYFPSELSSTVTDRIRHIILSMKSQGATIVPVSLPSTAYALSAYYVLASAEASSNMARYDGVEYGLRVNPPPGTDLRNTSDLYALSRSAGFGREVQKRILLGTYALSADAFDNYFLQAQRLRQLVKDDFNNVFRIPNNISISEPLPANEEGVDFLLHPSAIRAAPPLEPMADGSELDAYVQDVLTVPASLGGLPSISIPTRKVRHGPEGENLEDSEWPVGVSLVGQWGCDEMILKVGEVVQAISESDR